MCPSPQSTTSRRYRLRLARFSRRLTQLGLVQSFRALAVAARVHTGWRKDGTTRALVHQIEIAEYLMTLAPGLPPLDDVIAVALLHDIIEDHGIAPQYVSHEFGDVVGRAVWLLTRRHGDVRKPLQGYFKGIAQNALASVVKGADRIHNLQSMPGVFTVRKQRQYIDETVEHVLPMLAEARARMPQFGATYENLRVVLLGQIALLTYQRVVGEGDEGNPGVLGIPEDGAPSRDNRLFPR